MAAETSTSRWVIASIVALSVVALLAWARNDAGVDDRDPDPPQATTVVSGDDSAPAQAPPVDTDADAVPPTN